MQYSCGRADGKRDNSGGAIISTMSEANSPDLLSTGVDGLDEILRGGLIRDRLYLIEGAPGSGKTTMALQFLLEGVERGESCMFVSLSESTNELKTSAAMAHGWNLDRIHILEITPSERNLQVEVPYTMFHPADVELSETVARVLDEVDRIKPSRVVFDSLSELRLLSENTLRYRRQILALKRHFQSRHSTVFFIDDLTGVKGDMDLHSLAHGVITLVRKTTDYGTIRRYLQVSKLRGRAFREGTHDFIIQSGGVRIFPRLMRPEQSPAFVPQDIKSGLDSLDALLGGGLLKGTSTLISGAVGTGKSTLVTQFAIAAATRGERVALFMFEEALTTFIQRSDGLGMDVQRLIDSGLLVTRSIDAAELSPGEFAQAVKQTVDAGCSMVIIDSLNGFLNAMPNEQFLLLNLRELLIHLGERGVTSLLVMAQYGIVGDLESPLDASYIADTVLLLRYFEAFGEVRQAISVIKKRNGKHEKTIREFRLDNGVSIGEPLRGFHGVLSGIPKLTDATEAVDAARPA